MGNNRGFSLIELIVVMAIIGILVLLATPKFLNYIDMANIINIKNDIKVLENSIIADIVRNENIKYYDGFEEVDQVEFQNIIDNEEYYILDLEINDNFFEKSYVVPKIFINKHMNTRLKGEFIVTYDGYVMYVDNYTYDKDIDNNIFVVDNIKYEFINENNKKLGLRTLGYNKKLRSNNILELKNTIEYEGVDYSLIEVGNSAFFKDGINEVIFPNDLKIIGRRSFYGNNIKKIQFPENMERIGNESFLENPVEEVEIGEDIEIGSDIIGNKFNEYYRSNGSLSGIYSIIIQGGPSWNYRPILNDADIIQIKNDIRVLETTILDYYIKNGKFPKDRDLSIDITIFDDILENKRFFIKSGRVVEDNDNIFKKEFRNDYVVVSKDFVRTSTSTRLRGVFIVGKSGQIAYTENISYK